MKSKRLAVFMVTAVSVIGLYVADARADDDTPPSVTTTSTVTTIDESPPTTSDFGTEQEINIALNDAGEVVASDR